MTITKCSPKGPKKEEEKRLQPWQRVQGRLPEDMKLELPIEGCTRGHLLKGGHAEMRASGSDLPDFWSVYWEWRLLHNEGITIHVKQVHLLSTCRGRYCSA